MSSHNEACVLGDNPALHEHLSKTGLFYKSVSEDEAWPQEEALYLYAGYFQKAAIDKIRTLLHAKRFVLAPQKMRGLLSASEKLIFYPDELLLDIPGKISEIKQFTVGPTMVHEEVAKTSRAAIRRELWKLVLSAYAQQGLRCPTVPFYPKGFKSLVSFRVDADEYDREMFEVFFRTAKKYSHATSIFFSMANYERHADVIKRCLDHGFDVHSHAYTHYTYNSYAQNLYNLRKADDALYRMGIPTKGFASPYGRWNPNLQRAIECMDYQFSSEFSYNYDDLPSYPVVNGKRSSVLQIPVHPVGLGVYMESTNRFDEKEVRGYYAHLFDQKYQSEEPVIFYDHPTQWLGVYPQFMDWIFAEASTHGDIWKCSMSEWAAWWKTRSAQKGEIRLVDPRSVDFRNSHRTEEGTPYSDKRPFKRLKKGAKLWLDWETSTPRHEIIRDSLPSKLKYLLRKKI